MTDAGSNTVRTLPRPRAPRAMPMAPWGGGSAWTFPGRMATSASAGSSSVGNSDLLFHPLNARHLGQGEDQDLRAIAAVSLGLDAAVKLLRQRNAGHHQVHAPR